MRLVQAFISIRFNGLVLTLTLLICFFTAAAGIDAVSTADSTSTKVLRLASFDVKPQLTMAKYNKIKSGMTYKQVVKLLGAEGRETSSTNANGTKTTTYKWQDGDIKFIFGNFTNDKLTFKSQANLK
jgi:hypothetical protein